MYTILIEPVSNMPCELYIFKINDDTAFIEDFGQVLDLDPDNNDGIGCGNRSFILIQPTYDILNKYQINEEDYYEICRELASHLNIGKCGFCV